MSYVMGSVLLSATCVYVWQHRLQHALHDNTLYNSHPRSRLHSNL